MPSGGTRSRVIGIYLFLAAANSGIWLWAALAFSHQPVLLGTCLLAYGLGLRHAVDADHIAAIDNVTRKLMQEGKRPVGVGFFFSLGHSTVVVLATAFVALTANVLQARFSSFKEVGGVIGTSVSVFFLFVIAIMNIFILVETCRAFQRVRRGDNPDLASHHVVPPGGLLGRAFRPLFRLIRESWHMYPLGFLFGLGFDTATEVALLGISAAEVSKGLPLIDVLIFPALFTAGMSLVDTTDGILMLGAYGWAFVHPARKLFYNITITAVSVLIALVVGAIEALGFVADHFERVGKFWDLVRNLNQHFGTMGYFIIGLFLVSWLVSLLIYRVKGYDRPVI